MGDLAERWIVPDEAALEGYQQYYGGMLAALGHRQGQSPSSRRLAIEEHPETGGESRHRTDAGEGHAPTSARSRRVEDSTWEMGRVA